VGLAELNEERGVYAASTFKGSETLGWLPKVISDWWAALLRRHARPAGLAPPIRNYFGIRSRLTRRGLKVPGVNAG
jgi:hypothetical protein